MHPLQIVVVDQLHVSVRTNAEVERAPREEDGFVRQTGDADVRLGVKFGHLCIV
jgi:hypothetical protein